MLWFCVKMAEKGSRGLEDQSCPSHCGGRRWLYVPHREKTTDSFQSPARGRTAIKKYNHHQRG